MKLIKEWTPYFVVMVIAVVAAVEYALPAYQSGKAKLFNGGAA